MRDNLKVVVHVADNIWDEAHGNWNEIGISREDAERLLEAAQNLMKLFDE